MKTAGAGGQGPGAGEPRGKVESISHFRDLQVWQRGMGIVQSIYEISAGSPKAEIYGLTSQLRRAAVSVPSNIAEGHTRASTKEYLHHLSMAQASLAEVETQLELAARFKFASSEELQPIQAECGILSKQLYHLRDALEKRLRRIPGPQSLAPGPQTEAPGPNF